MERNIQTGTVTPDTQVAVGECMGLDGNDCGAGDYVYGIVKQINKGADEAAEIYTKGECYALVDGDSVDVAVGDHLKCDASQHLVKASVTGAQLGGTAGTTDITIEESHIVALEANTGAAALKRVLVQ